MNRFLKIMLLFSIGITIVSCSKSDNNSAPLRDYAEQYAKDLTNIETFMDTHYMTVVNNPGGDDDMDVTFTLIPDGGTQLSIMDDPAFVKETRDVKITYDDDTEVTYKIYFIKLREGVGQSPCNVDPVLAAYKGEYIYSKTTTENGTDVTRILSEEFETQANPQGYASLTGVIRGWSEIFPQFKTGNYTGNPDGTISYTNFGAGVMFIPSGLAYFNGTKGGIPSYSPLIFNIKLYEIQRADQDGDGIDSYQEDISGPNGVPDGYMYSLKEGIVNVDDSDGDEIPDFLDIDDDGDNFTTNTEIKYVNPLDPEHITRYYPFNGTAVDDPATPYVDETKGVPRKFTGPNNTQGQPTSNNPADFTDPARLRRYRDATAKPPYSDQ